MPLEVSFGTTVPDTVLYFMNVPWFVQLNIIRNARGEVNSITKSATN